MNETIQSVKEYGVTVPAIVRPRQEGGYEIVAGHRRKFACEQAGLDTVPVPIRSLQRENILPSERAKACKMKPEAIKRQGARNDLTSPNISARSGSDDEIGQQMGVSGNTVRNYISLTNLVPELMRNRRSSRKRGKPRTGRSAFCAPWGLNWWRSRRSTAYREAVPLPVLWLFPAPYLDGLQVILTCEKNCSHVAIESLPLRCII